MAKWCAFHIAVQVFQIVNKVSPSYLFFSCCRCYRLFQIDRNLYRSYVPGMRTNYGKQALWYRGTTIRNRMPGVKGRQQSISIFKLFQDYNHFLKINELKISILAKLCTRFQYSETFQCLY